MRLLFSLGAGLPLLEARYVFATEADLLNSALFGLRRWPLRIFWAKVSLDRYAVVASSLVL